MDELVSRTLLLQTSGAEISEEHCGIAGGHGQAPPLTGTLSGDASTASAWPFPQHKLATRATNPAILPFFFTAALGLKDLGSSEAGADS